MKVGAFSAQKIFLVLGPVGFSATERVDEF